MSRKTTSIKGEEVDFDLFKIKSEINQSPKTSNVREREEYIDRKRRRTRPNAGKLIDEQEKNKTRVQRALENQKKQTPKEKEPKSNASIDAEELVNETLVSELEKATAEEKKVAKKAPVKKKKRVVRKK